MIKAFVFDLDGVITDTAELHYKAWKALADSLDIDFDETANEALKGIDRMGSLERILGNRAADFSIAEKHQLATQKNQHYQSLIKTLTPADILPGVEQALAELRERGLHIGMASASKNAQAVVSSLGLQDAFDYIADAAQIANSKPDPEVFNNVAEHFDVAGSECIGVEDAFAGVQAIKAAGMYAVGVGNAQVLNNADVVISDMTAFDVPRFISAAG